MATCPGLGSDGPFVSGMLGYIDCQSLALGESGYRALATPGSSASLLLTAALTVFVALFGYRMLFGQVPAMRDATLAAVKVGFVLLLATSWAGYRTLVYDVVMHGPADLATEIGGAAALPGAGGGLVERLELVDEAMAELARIGTGKPLDADPVVGQTVPLTPEQQREQLQELRSRSERPRWDAQRDQAMVNEARTLYLVGAVGSLAALRLVGGLLLALGPVFALFLLFDATRGVFEGWVRALGGVVLGGVSSAVVLGVQLALFEPWLAAILADRQAYLPTPAVPVELLAASLVFTLTIVAGLIAAARVAHGLHVPIAVRRMAERALAGGRSQASVTTVRDGTTLPAEAENRSRARTIADAAAATQRREDESARQLPAVRLVEGRGGDTPRTPLRGVAATAVQPIGQSARRRTAGRVSTGRERRDAR